MSLDFQTALADVPLVAILRGLRPDEATSIGDALWQARHPHHRGAAQLTRPAGEHSPAGPSPGRDLVIGAGTVLTVDDVDRVVAAGRPPDRQPQHRRQRHPADDRSRRDLAARRRDGDRGVRRVRQRRALPEIVPGQHLRHRAREGPAGGPAAGRAVARRRRHFAARRSGMDGCRRVWHRHGIGDLSARRQCGHGARQGPCRGQRTSPGETRE